MTSKTSRKFAVADMLPRKCGGVLIEKAVEKEAHRGFVSACKLPRRSQPREAVSGQVLCWERAYGAGTKTVWISCLHRLPLMLEPARSG